MRTPFKLRSASPFKNERMVHTEGGKNLLKDVTVKKGKKSIYTYRKMHADLLAKGVSKADADKQVQKAKGFNQEKYGTQNPTKEGLTNNYREEKGSMEMKDVASLGTEGKKGQDGAMMDSFSPQETRMSIREFKINDNRFNRRGNKDRKYNNRYEKGLGFDPSTLNDELKASDPEKYKALNLRKQAYDKSRKGEKQLMKISQNKREMDYYDNRTKNSEMAGRQGVNQADGTQVQYDPDNVGLQKRTASTEGTPGSATTEASADDIANLKNTDSIDLGKDTSDSSYTESLSGGDNKQEMKMLGGAGPADSNTETTETDNSSLMQGAKDMFNKAKATAHAAALGPMGQLLNIDGDGDGDTVLNDKNNDGTMLTRFMSKIMGGGVDTDAAKTIVSGATKYGRDRSAAPFKLKKYK